MKLMVFRFVSVGPQKRVADMLKDLLDKGTNLIILDPRIRQRQLCACPTGCIIAAISDGRCVGPVYEFIGTGITNMEALAGHLAHNRSPF